MREKSDIECPICTRETPFNCQEKHHLVPKAKKGKITVLVCCSCGDMVHKLFTLKELAKEYNTIDKIRANEDVQKWVAWIKKKPNDFSVCMMKKKGRTNKKKSRR